MKIHSQYTNGSSAGGSDPPDFLPNAGAHLGGNQREECLEYLLCNLENQMELEVAASQPSTNMEASLKFLT